MISMQTAAPIESNPFTRRILTGFLALSLAALCALALASCGHEPEKATPPADDSQSQVESEQQDATDSTADGSEAADDSATAESQATDASQNDQAAEDNADEKKDAAAHKGPFVISVLNAGGADGLAGAAQEKLVSAGMDGDGYQISADSYLGGIVSETTVYVSGEGDDAAAVKAEADKVAKALGGKVKTFKSGELADGTTMDGLDILVLVGSDAVQ